MTSRFSGRRFEQFVIPPVEYIQIPDPIPGSGVNAPDGCRGIRAGTAGAANVTMNGNAIQSFPLLQGDNPGFFDSIQGVPGSGAASNLWWIV